MRSLALTVVFAAVFSWSVAVQSNERVLNCARPDGDHIVSMEMVCPVGGEKFQGMVFGSYSTYGVHLDWEPISYLSFPLPMPVCPSSGFVHHKETYTDADLKRYARVISSEPYKKIYAQKHASYYLFSRFLDLAGDENESRWWQLLQATWEADQCGSDKYAFYAGEAIEAARFRLSSLKPVDNEYWVLNIIIPNLFRRTGQFERAQKWLDAFGRQEPTDKDSKESYGLAFDLLRTAVSEKNVQQIKIADPSGNQ